ncbi:MAG: UDP-N-acetylmuramate--L-alanine ligase [Kiritimatiellae bacterium]|jgi:UDP-N-acetylmuramate--alanine ligase|nr:UDP-N-acetylmuramate--L-alanine ligase [Kiritimatiellia bacterium]
MFEPKSHIHFVGICGIGMAGLAYMLSKRGFIVSGCDENLNLLASWLEKSGVKVKEGHDSNHITSDVSFIVRTPAVSDDEQELVVARQQNIPVYSRGEVLSKLLSYYSDSIAVAGTHGKTTTSTFIAQVLKSAGLDPSWIIGGENDTLGSIADDGAGDVLVAESDESDGSLALYSPKYSVINNIEFDHMDYFKSREEFVECFQAFINGTQDKIFYNKDDKVCCDLLDGFNTISFGFSESADYCISDVAANTQGTQFNVKHNDNVHCFSIPIQGNHNILNASATIAVAVELGIDIALLQIYMGKISLPKRRFETVYDRDDIRVITDYSHHPTEVAVMVNTAKALKPKKLRVVFQPHRYTRTKTLGHEFPASFEGVDELILLPVYSASEDVLDGGTVSDLYQHFLEARKDNPLIPKPLLSFSIDDVTDFYRATLEPGDMLLVTGAGSVNNVAETIRGNGIAEKVVVPSELNSVIIENKPLGHKTTFGCGGNADFYADVDSEDSLKKVYEFATGNSLPLKFIGGGSNVLVSDIGVRGIVCRFIKAFAGIYCDGEGCIVVGAGVTNSSLVQYMNEKNYTGLEFLVGVPGTVGGAVTMNAGAFGSEIFDYIMSVEYYDGSFAALNREHMKATYRKAPKALKNKIITRVVLKVKKTDSPSLAIQEQYRDKRKWQKQYRTAGSTFKNPAENVYAGELIQNTFINSVKIGGAFTAKEHFNFICTDKTASSSDVLALINWIKWSVEKKYNITLETEVILL